MNIFNFIGRWWGVAIAFISIVIAGIIGGFMNNPIASLVVGVLCGWLGGLVMIRIGERYDSE